MANLVKTVAFLAALLTGGVGECFAADPPRALSKSRARLRVPIRCRVYLRRPRTAGPSPAVVLLHSCNGDWRRLDERWGKRIASWGYVTLAVDSLGSRGLQKLRPRQRLGTIKPADAYRALKFLVRDPFVDPDRVAVSGFCERRPDRSDVGRTRLSGTGIANDKFRAAVAFYPRCLGFKGEHDRAGADPDRRTRRLGLGQGVPEYGRGPRRLGNIEAEGQGRADRAHGVSRRLSRIRCAGRSRLRSS